MYRQGMNLSGCGCANCNGGLAGMGLLSPTATSPTASCEGLPIIERILCEARKVVGSVTPAPRYPAPGLPQYPTIPAYPTDGYEAFPTMAETNWLPIVAGLGVLFLLTRKK